MLFFPPVGLLKAKVVHSDRDIKKPLEVHDNLSWVHYAAGYYGCSSPRDSVSMQGLGSYQKDG